MPSAAATEGTTAPREPEREFAIRALGLRPHLRAILALLAAGYDNPTISARTGLTVGSVKTHVSTLYKLLGVPRGFYARVWLALQYRAVFHRDTWELPLHDAEPLPERLKAARLEERRVGGRKGGLARHGNPEPLPGLRAAREAAGLSQARLALRAGLTNGNHVRKIELGGRASPATRAKLAAALGVDEAQLGAPPSGPL